jgi:hypothetical protein
VCKDSRAEKLEQSRRHHHRIRREKVENVYDYAFALQQFKAAILLRRVRDSATVSLSVTLSDPLHSKAECGGG